MDFICPKADLLHAVQIVSKAIPSSTSESVLLNVLMKADDGGGLSLFATDNRISIRQRLSVKLSDGGEITLPGGLLSEILQSMQTVDADEIRFEMKADRKVDISATGASYSLSGPDPKSFPLIPSPDGDIEFTISGDKLRSIIRQVVITESSGSSVAKGYDKALFEAEGGKLTVVTTDTVRLAVREITIEDLPDFTMMVPMHALNELNKILTPSSDVKILIGSDQVSFTFGDTELQARLCEKEFPAYRKIIPKEQSRHFIIETKTLVNAIKGVMPVAKESQMKIDLAVGDGKLVVTAQSHEGSAKREVDVEMEGEDIELSFNAKYILDFLAVCDSKKVKWGVTSTIRPATMRPADDETSYLYLLMPINI